MELFRVMALLTTNLDPKDSNVTEGRGNGGGLREICPEMHDGAWARRELFRVKALDMP